VELNFPAQVNPMATTLSKRPKPKRLNKPKATDPARRPAADAQDEAVNEAHLVLSDHDRDIVLRALTTKKPNAALHAAAKKYKEQCA